MLSVLRNLRSAMVRLVEASLLSKTTLETRFVLSLAICSVIFTDDLFIIAISTSVIFIIVLADPYFGKRSKIIIFAPLFVGLLIFVSKWLGGEKIVLAIIGASLLGWKLFVIFLAAIVFEVLVPLKHFQYLIRSVPSKKVWAATVAAIRSVPMATWAYLTVRRSQSSRGINLFSVMGADSMFTGLFGHFNEFVEDFEISLRSRGVESDRVTPFDELPKFDYYDLAVYAIILSVLSLHLY